MMANRTVVWLVVSLLAALVSGCCSVERVYRPADGCGGGWDPVLGSCHDCGGEAGCTAHSPCQSTRHLLTCGSGCGEIYWGEWLSDPPDACDPCDDCGNWIGPRCCPPRWWQTFWCGAPGWWGWRCGTDVGCCDGEGCSSCTGEPSDVWSGTEIIEEVTPGRQGEPQPAVSQPAAPQPAAEMMEQPAPAETAAPPTAGSQAAVRRPVRGAAAQKVPSYQVRPTRHQHPHPAPARHQPTRGQ